MEAGPALFAVHLADGYLRWPWWVGGFVAFALVVAVTQARLADDAVPKLGVLTAVFFVGSQVHFAFGPVSVHLLLNGLVGVVVGGRAAIPIGVGLALQWFLHGHGGLTTLGLNGVVLALPALAAGWLFRVRPWRFPAAVGGALAALAALAAVLSNAALLYFGTDGDWLWVARASATAHVPIVALEGLIAASAVRVLARARPEWLGLPTYSSGNTSSNGTSH